MYSFLRPHVDRLMEFISGSDMRIIAIIGPRQVGKTIIAMQGRDQLIQSGFTCQYHSFDDPHINQSDWSPESSIMDVLTVNQFANPQTLVTIWESARKASLESPKGHVLFLDEVQLIPQWSNYVKGLWDHDRREGYPLHVVILGSAVWQMLVGRNESLTGRFRELSVQHWSFPEMAEVFGLTVEQFIYYGGYPGSWPGACEKSKFDYWHSYILKTIIGSVIGRDIVMLKQIKKPALMHQLVELAPTYSGQIMAYNKLVGALQDKGNVTTIKHYLNLLADAGLIATLSRYTPRPHLGSISHPKFNVLNTALMTAPSGYSFREVQNDDRTFWGRVVESAVGAHLWNTGDLATRIHYWRDREEKYEVDFVISRGPHLVGIEVKSGLKKRYQGLDVFKERYTHAKTMIVGPSGFPFNEFFPFPPTSGLSIYKMIKDRILRTVRLIEPQKDHRFGQAGLTLDDFDSHHGVILFGDPGMGKSTEFDTATRGMDEKYCVSAHEFLRCDPDDDPIWRTKTLFIDGLDEVRIGGGDPRTVLDQIITRSKDLERLNFVCLFALPAGCVQVI